MISFTYIITDLFELNISKKLLIAFRMISWRLVYGILFPCSLHKLLKYLKSNWLQNIINCKWKTNLLIL